MRSLLLAALLLTLTACDRPADTGTMDNTPEMPPRPTNTAVAPTTPPPTAPATTTEAPPPPKQPERATPPPRPVPQRPGGANAIPMPSSDAPRLTFTKPEGWVEEKPRSSMRQAQYALPIEGEGNKALGLAVFFLQGTVEQNIARWRTQFTKPDGSNPSAEESPTETFETNGLPVSMVSISGSYVAPPFMGGGTIESATMLAAGIEGDERGNWYIRVVGPSDAIAAHADRFRAFLESARPAE